MWAMLALWSCTWTRAPGPAPMVEAAKPIRLVGQPADGQVTWLDLTIRAGSAHDPVGQEGLAWHTANLLREGGAGGRDKAAVDALLYRLGTDVEVMVDRELISLRVRCLTEDLPEVTDLLGDMLLEPSLDEAALARLVGSAQTALETGIAESDEGLGMAAMDSWLFAGHRYAHPPQGRAGVLETLTVDDVRNFLDARYIRPAAVLGVAGPMIGVDGAVRSDAPGADAITALAGRLSAGLAPTLYTDVTPRAVDVVEGREVLIIEKETEAVGAHIGQVTSLRRDHPDWPAMLLAMTAFGEHRQSHGQLYRAFRAQRGLNYGSYAYIESYRPDGWSREQETSTGRVQNSFYMWLRPMSSENALFAVKGAVRMLEQLHAEGLEASEFERMRTYMVGRVALWAASPERRLGWAVEAQVMGWPDPIETLPAALRALDRASVHRAIQEHLDPEDLRIVLVAGDAEALAAKIRPPAEGSEYPATPIVYEGTPPASGSPQAAEDEAISQYDLDARQVTILTSEELFR